MQCKGSQVVIALLNAWIIIIISGYQIQNVIGQNFLSKMLGKSWLSQKAAPVQPRSSQIQTPAQDKLFFPPYVFPFWGLPYGMYSNGGFFNPGLFPFVPGGPGFPPYDGIFGGPFGPGAFPGSGPTPFKYPPYDGSGMTGGKDGKGGAKGGSKKTKKGKGKKKGADSSKYSSPGNSTATETPPTKPKCKKPCKPKSTPAPMYMPEPYPANPMSYSNYQAPQENLSSYSSAQQAAAPASPTSYNNYPAPQENLSSYSSNTPTPAPMNYGNYPPPPESLSSYSQPQSYRKPCGGQNKHKCGNKGGNYQLHGNYSPSPAPENLPSYSNTQQYPSAPMNYGNYPQSPGELPPMSYGNNNNIPSPENLSSYSTSSVQPRKPCNSQNKQMCGNNGATGNYSPPKPPQNTYSQMDNYNSPAPPAPIYNTEQLSQGVNNYNPGGVSIYNNIPPQMTPPSSPVYNVQQFPQYSTGYPAPPPEPSYTITYNTPPPPPEPSYTITYNTPPPQGPSPPEMTNYNSPPPPVPAYYPSEIFYDSSTLNLPPPPNPVKMSMSVEPSGPAVLPLPEYASSTDMTSNSNYQTDQQPPTRSHYYGKNMHMPSAPTPGPPKPQTNYIVTVESGPLYSPDPVNPSPSSKPKYLNQEQHPIVDQPIVNTNFSSLQSQKDPNPIQGPMKSSAEYDKGPVTPPQPPPRQYDVAHSFTIGKDFNSHNVSIVSTTTDNTNAVTRFKPTAAPIQPVYRRRPTTTTTKSLSAPANSPSPLNYGPADPSAYYTDVVNNNTTGLYYTKSVKKR